MPRASKYRERGPPLDEDSENYGPQPLAIKIYATSMVARIVENQPTSEIAASRTFPLKVLLVATRFELPYRALRCAQASGAEVYVLGNSSASPLRFSRYCKRFFLSKYRIHAEEDPVLAREICRIARELAIDMIIPGDDISMRALIASGDSLLTPCFPHTTLNNFDLLNNKWKFATLCAEISLPHPSTRLLSDGSDLLREVRSCSPEHALIAKPLSLSGGEGIVLFDGIATEERVRSIWYRPVLLQQFIHGQDICATVYAHKGSVRKFICYSYCRKTYVAFHDQRIYADLERLITHLDLDGVYNFDIRITPDGSLYYLECNPRFFHNMNLSLVGGVNFVRLGLPSGELQPAIFLSTPVQVRQPEAALRCAPWRLTRRDFDMAVYLLSDPLPYLIEKLRLHLLVAGASRVHRYRPA